MIKYLTLQKKDVKDFAKERNLLMKKTKGDWLFFVDSDEVVSSDLRKEAQNQVMKGKCDAFYVYRRNFFLDYYVGRDVSIRLVKKGSGKWVRRVHEVYKLNKNSNSVGRLDNPLIHNTADSLSFYLSKINSYSTLHAKANKEEGKVSGLFKIIIFPVLKFIQTYIKSRNVVFSIMQSTHSFLSWSKLYFLQH